MYALITGASSGIGKEIAILLAQKGYSLILVARREERLAKLKRQLEKRCPIHVVCKPCDLADRDAVLALYESCQGLPVSILVNSAGFGKVGSLLSVPLEDELSMVETNIAALHILTKQFARSMEQGYILNIASIAAFQPGPYLAAYSATKAYVASLSLALRYEMKRLKKDISVSVLCPGPVRTEFDQVAGTHFSLKSISPKYCAKIALKGMFQKKALIVPSLAIKLAYLASKLSPLKIILPVEYLIQMRKLK